MAGKDFIMNGPASEAIMDEPETQEIEEKSAPAKKTVAKKTARAKS